MADPFSLVGRTPPPPPAGSPVARPSFFDRFLGRGEYMKRFAKERAVHFDQARLEKRRVRKQFRRDQKEYLRKIERGDRRTAQRFDIRPAQRHTKTGADESEQKKLLHRSTELVKKEIREQEREAMRSIELQRDRNVRQMRDDLRKGLYETAA